MWKVLVAIVMMLLGKNPVKNYVKCPFCSHEDTVQGFIYWQRNGISGFRGKLPNGDMVVACPECLIELRYDVLLERVVVYKL